jgi:hypothetical protein
MREANGGIDAANGAQIEGYSRHKRLHIRYLFQWPFPEDPWGMAKMAKEILIGFHPETLKFPSPSDGGGVGWGW